MSQCLRGRFCSSDHARCRRCRAIPAIGALRAPWPSADVPSARHPPPIDVLLKTKAEPQFDRPVEGAVDPSFLVFPTLNHVVSSLSRSVGFASYRLLTYSPTKNQRIASKHSPIISECRANFAGFDDPPDLFFFWSRHKVGAQSFASQPARPIKLIADAKVGSRIAFRKQPQWSSYRYYWEKRDRYKSKLHRTHPLRPWSGRRVQTVSRDAKDGAPTVWWDRKERESWGTKQSKLFLFQKILA